MKQRNIRDLSALLEEKQRLSVSVRMQEQELKDRVKLFRKDYMGILLAQVSPFKDKSVAGISRTILSWVNSPIGSAVTGQLLGTGIGSTAARLGMRLVGSLWKRKKKAQPEAGI